MKTPLHVCPIGTALPADYFSPGTFVLNGRITGSLWAIAFWQGNKFRFERTSIEMPWFRVS
jgi:hypothetical protein